MQKYFLSIFVLGITLTCYSQKSAKYYKKLADDFMYRQIDSSVVKQINCYAYSAKGIDDSTYYGGFYDEEKNKILKDIQWIAFSYDFYSRKLNHTLHWYLTINSKEQVLPLFMISKTFPKCISENRKCDIVTKDSALKIATKDSLRFPNNCYIELLSPKHSDQFYWAITGVDKKNYNYNIRPKKGKYAPIPPWRKDYTKIIEASSGKVISLQEYYKLDKE